MPHRPKPRDDTRGVLLFFFFASVEGEGGGEESEKHRDDADEVGEAGRRAGRLLFRFDDIVEDEEDMVPRLRPSLDRSVMALSISPLQINVTRDNDDR